MTTMMNNLLTNMLHQGRLCRAEGKCPKCKVLVDLSSFVDEISKREYAISGLCQDCQNEIFCDDDDDGEEY